MGETLNRDEVLSLLEETERDFHGIRDRAYLTILWRCGLRNNECRMLDVFDVDRDGAWWSLRVRHVKAASLGARPRTIGIDPRAREVLAEWLRIREHMDIDTDALFVTRQGERIDTSHFRRKLQILRRKAGMKRRVHPHALRHTFARGLVDDGVPMRVIQLALGHSSLQTTAAYLQSIGDPEVIAATSERDW